MEEYKTILFNPKGFQLHLKKIKLNTSKSIKGASTFVVICA